MQCWKFIYNILKSWHLSYYVDLTSFSITIQEVVAQKCQKFKFHVKLVKLQCLEESFWALHSVSMDSHARRNSNFRGNFTRSRWWWRWSAICQDFAAVLTSRPFGIRSPCSKLMSMMSSLVHKRTEVASMKIIQYGHSWLFLLLSW